MTPTSRPRLLVAVAALVALLALVAVPGAQAKSSGRHHARSADRNRDRIPDRWERRFHLSLTRNQARRDQDHDGLRNRAEYLARTDPRDADTDGDGRRDGREDAGQVVSFDGDHPRREVVRRRDGDRDGLGGHRAALPLGRRPRDRGGGRRRARRARRLRRRTG